MKIIFAVHTYNGFNGEVKDLHSREWAADWHAWKLAKEAVSSPVWLGNPVWGYPGWAAKHDGEAVTWVVTWKVTVP